MKTGIHNFNTLFMNMNMNIKIKRKKKYIVNSLWNGYIINIGGIFLSSFFLVSLAQSLLFFSSSFIYWVPAPKKSGSVWSKCDCDNKTQNATISPIHCNPLV